MKNRDLNFKHSDFSNKLGAEFTISVNILPDLNRGGVCVDQRWLALLSGNLASDVWDDMHLTDSEKLLLEAFISSVIARQYPKT